MRRMGGDGARFRGGKAYWNSIQIMSIIYIKCN